MDATPEVTPQKAKGAPFYVWTCPACQREQCCQSAGAAACASCGQAVTVLRLRPWRRKKASPEWESLR